MNLVNLGGYINETWNNITHTRSNHYSPTFLGYRSQEAQQYYAIGLGGMVVGGVLAIAGIVMMIVKRK
jgi:hypothetical protein